MRARFVLSLVSAFVLCLIVFLAMSANVGNASTLSSAYALDKELYGRITGATPTPATVYLPLVLKNYGGCSVIPELRSPANGSRLNTIAPLFRWYVEDNPYVTSFYMEVAEDPDFEFPVVGLYASGDVVGEQEFRVTQNLDPATTYYWRARVACGELDGPYSAVWSFTTGSGGTILNAPTLISPTNGSQLTTTVATLRWQAVPGAVEYLVRWRRVGSLGYSFMWVSGTQATLRQLSPNTTYEWWVAARNEYAIGNSSATWRFTTGTSSSSIRYKTPTATAIVKGKTITVTLSGR